uniref:NAD(P)(+)--arginine ADP-ribosyltransferase n=1 Tax=Xiphophorus couchianus TaxID=32473 RepID=A0A3B5M8H6_9TELE
MAENSVDDMYEGCENKMATKVMTELLAREKKMTKNFRLAWDEPGMKKSQVLEKEQNMAVYAYTLDKPEIFTEFNNALRTQRAQYTSTFQYHSLHFFLTGALRALNCVKTYRRTNCKFETDINREIRFGGFTSSSEGGYPSPHFGDQSCFEITTCFGARISKFSMFESENEVLIPPYEVFKVTDIQKRSGKNFLPCQVVYKLKSTNNPRSSLNCALTKSERTNHGYSCLYLGNAANIR